MIYKLILLSYLTYFTNESMNISEKAKNYKKNIFLDLEI
jgi:hypothetical protein